MANEYYSPQGPSINDYEQMGIYIKQLQEKIYFLQNDLHITKVALTNIQNFNVATSTNERNTRTIASDALGKIQVQNRT